MNLKESFLNYCEVNQYEINKNQLNIINNLREYYKKNFNQSLINKILKKKILNLGFI